MDEFNADLYMIMEKALRILRANIKRILDDFEMGDLTFAEMNIMTIIGEESMTMKDIVTEMSIANSTPTRIIDGLVSKGIVERFSDDGDRRRVIVRLTSFGVELYMKIREKLNEQTEKAISGLTEDEKKSFAGIINNIVANLETME
jgi:DNA-binding MarR family transcriptional regulator